MFSILLQSILALLSSTSPSNAAIPSGNLCSVTQPKVPGTFPTAFTIASILSTDTTARMLYSTIKNDTRYGNALNGGIAIKGTTPNGYDYNADPDCWWTFSNCKIPKRSWLPSDYFTCSEGKTWGLSIDDGPNCNNNLLYDFLKSVNVKGSVFYIGSNVVTYPYNAQRGVEEGYEVCGHTWSHNAMTTLTDEQVFAELYYTKQAIYAATGLSVKCWRPPYGDVDDRVRTWAFALGMRTVLWDHDTDDYELTVGTPQSTIDQNYQNVYNVASSNKGVVVLQHEIADATMNEFIRQYPTLIQHFPNVMPVSTCYNDTIPYIEREITFPDFQGYVNGIRSSSDLTANFTTGSASFISYDQAIASPAPSASPSVSSSTLSATDSSSSSTSTRTKTQTSSQSTSTGTVGNSGTLMLKKQSISSKFWFSFVFMMTVSISFS